MPIATSASGIAPGSLSVRILNTINSKPVTSTVAAAIGCALHRPVVRVLCIVIPRIAARLAAAQACSREVWWG
jgi:hypothetical protein